VLSLANIQPRQKRMLEVVGLLQALNVHDGLSTEVTAEGDTDTRMGALYFHSIVGGYPDASVLNIAAISPHLK
jgi:hypothetical protein